MLVVRRVKFILIVKGSFDAFFEVYFEFFDDLQSDSRDHGDFDVIENVEEKLTDFDLLFMRGLFSAVDFQLFEQVQHPLNEEEILPSFVTDITPSHFLIQQREDYVVPVRGNQASLDKQTREIGDIFVLVGEVFERDEVENDLKVYFGVLALE